jgi:hypothetical protein
MDILSPGLVSLLLPSLRRRPEKSSLFFPNIVWLSPGWKRFDLRPGTGPEKLREHVSTRREGS